MRDQIIWKPIVLDTESYGRRTVYVKHYFVPFAGLMSAADTAFTVPAYIRVRGARITGFVTPRDGMAYQQDHAAPWFVAHTESAARAAAPAGTAAPHVVPNMDSLDASDLRAFWTRHRDGRNARDLFPAGGNGTRRATADLASYASNKATAVECRLSGRIDSALGYESICERIYRRLPSAVRW